jgi:hypothetical protein
MKRLVWFWLGLLSVGLWVGMWRFYLLPALPVFLFWWLAGRLLPQKYPDIARGVYWAALIGSFLGLFLSGAIVYELLPIESILLGTIIGVPVLQGISLGIGSGGWSGIAGWFIGIIGSYVGIALFFRWMQFCLALPAELALLSPELSFTLLLWSLVFAPLALCGALGAGFFLLRVKE